VKLVVGVLGLFLLMGCSSDEITVQLKLKTLLEEKEVVIDNVIACAATNQNDDLVSVYLYPRAGVTNVQYFETATADVDKNDYENYTRKRVALDDVFNGYLQRFQVAVSEEKWVIVSFEEEGKVHLSNPIRLKQQSKPTEYSSENVSLDTTSPMMPTFTWLDGIYDDTKIYFHVVTDAENNLLSGTYSFDRMFQYYKLDNVVLNITTVPAPELISGTSYGFTMLAVSEDNWVNLFSEISFETP